MTHNAALELPSPAADAAALSERLCQQIRAAIEAAGGSVSFERYMEMALYEPGLGYYSAGCTKFGRDGDFITAPELSPLFGRCLAAQVQEVLADLEDGDVLEFGAGSGRLAADVLCELERLQTLPQCYFILEVSAELRARQRQRIEADAPHLLPRVRWLDTWPPSPIHGVLLANEVLDAMPVARVHKGRDQRWFELHVSTAGDQFAWRHVPFTVSTPLAAAMAQIEQECGPLPSGYTTEINSRLAPWFRSLSESFARGVMLILDYGYPRREYYHPQRSDGTLVCHYRHRVHDDPFHLVGLQDITASVDFTAVAEAAHEAGFAVTGFATQAQFLVALGVTDLLAEATAAEPARQYVLAQQVQRLTLPGEMGERVQVLGLTKGMTASLRGYAAVNQSHRL
ncbi:MAG: class I SAM-dependent methyltransferase [Chromatiales bacterium]